MAEYLSHRTSELGTPESRVLGRFEFDIVGTLTWARVPPLSVQEKCNAELIRRVAKQVYHVPGHLDLLYGIRYEIGEKTGRHHNHIIIGAHRNQPTTNKTTIAHQIKHIWENQVKQLKDKRFRPCVGFADIRPYDSTKAGAEYICKPALSARDFYELQKFHDGFKLSDGSDATRVSLGPQLILEIAKIKNRRPNKVPGFARFLKDWKQRNLNPKRVSQKKQNYKVLPHQGSFEHPRYDPLTRLYC